MDGQKTILQDGTLFSTHPFSTKNHKTTTIPLGGFWRFFRGRCGKATLFQRLLFTHPHPLKNRWNRGGDDRQVSQNGMPFCTGCTLSGHILTCQRGFAPLEPPFSFPKMKLRNIRWKFLHSIFGFAGECTYCIWLMPTDVSGRHWVNYAIYAAGKSFRGLCRQPFCKFL